MPAHRIEFDEPDAGVIWYGQMVDDSRGYIAFGRNEAGDLKVRIVCDMPDGTLRQCDGGFPDGRVIVEWLHEWFCQPDHDEDRNP